MADPAGLLEPDDGASTVSLPPTEPRSTTGPRYDEELEGVDGREAPESRDLPRESRSTLGVVVLGGLVVTALPR
jgi:hypothetical protein